jgi:hypothetical protein
MYDIDTERLRFNCDAICFESNSRLDAGVWELLERKLTERYWIRYHVGSRELVGDWRLDCEPLGHRWASDVIALYRAHGVEEDGDYYPEFIFYRARWASEMFGKEERLAEWVHVPCRKTQSKLERSGNWLTGLDLRKFKTINRYVKRIATDPGVWEPHFGSEAQSAEVGVFIPRG